MDSVIRDHSLTKRPTKKPVIPAPFASPYLIIFLLLSGLLFVGCGSKQKTPPNSNIVATYDDSEITIEDLERYFEERTKGLKIPVGDSLVSLSDQLPKDKETYRGLIREMVLDEMVKRKIKEKQLDNRGNIRHALEHMEDELTLQQLHAEMHEQNRIPVGENEIRQYYDENRSRFGDEPLYKVRDEIKNILVSQKEDEYVTGYINELMDAATITRNYDLLRVPEPTEQELLAAYEQNKENYLEPEKWVIDFIEVADSGATARTSAQKAWNRLGSGASFESVAATFGRDKTFISTDYIVGTRGETFDRAVTSLNPGEFSKPIEENGKYFIVRLNKKLPASYVPFDDARSLIRRLLMDEREKQLYEENRNKTLFTMHGRRYTLGDFYQEFMELPYADRERLRTYEERVKFVDRMIDRLLLLEDSYDRMLNARKKEEIEHVREDVLKQVLHREEVDQMLNVNEEDARQVYEENKELFKTPARVKISIIVVRGGEDDNSNRKAKEKIDEVYDKLRPGFFRKKMSFEEAARQYSEDPATAQNGGEVDAWISETNNPLYELFNHSFHENFIALKPGEITEPFTIGNEYIIVKVRERQEPQQQSFEAIKEHLMEDLRLQKHEELTVKMYTEMIDRANLVIYDPVLESMINKQEKGDNMQ